MRASIPHPLALLRSIHRALLPSLLVAAGGACAYSQEPGTSSVEQASIIGGGGSTSGGSGGGGYLSDGRKDIVWKQGWTAWGSDANIDADPQIAFWHYHSATDVTKAVVASDASHLTPIAEADFWGDNSKGLLLCGLTSLDCWAWKMLGSAVIGKEHVGSRGRDWHLAGTWDVDGDGHKDVVWLDFVTGVHTWLMNGGAYRQVDANLPGRAPLGVGALDGVNPYLLELDNGLSLRAVRITPNGTLAPEGEQLIAGPEGPWGPDGVGDVNGDGRADIFWRNRDTGQMGIWLMNGTSVQGYVIPGGAPFVWRPIEMADYDGDGRVDILWQNMSTGDVGIWFLDPGGSVRTYGMLGSADCSWSIIAETGLYATISCPVPPPPPPPACAKRGEALTSAGCCDPANDEPWGGRCEPKDPPGCGLLLQADWAPCCFHRASQCDSNTVTHDPGVCSKDDTGQYVCIGDATGQPCGSAPLLTCTLDCGNGNISSGQYCSTQDAANANVNSSGPACTPTCR